jgi:hypothetical protein
MASTAETIEILKTAIANVSSGILEVRSADGRTIKYAPLPELCSTLAKFERKLAIESGSMAKVRLGDFNV